MSIAPFVSLAESDPEPAPAHETPRVILVTPHYGSVSMGLRQTLNGAVRDRRQLSVVMEAQSCSSVLPHCFNELLCVALNARDEGKVTHLAMAHADILADVGWLDKLWGEMWLHNLALISCVVPIKGPTGRTSTAIGDEADRWKVHRCINIKDRATMPVTFGPDSVCRPGEVLLVNTGLFLADLRLPFWDDFAFQFHTRIKKTPAGRVSECRSEDWELSHDLHAAGLKYRATWAVKLKHEGGGRYPNYPESS